MAPTKTHLMPSDAALSLADRVLLVEDTEDDVALFRRLMKQACGETGLDIAMDGETALHWLTEKLAEAEAGRRILPRAIFIDLKLPGMSGLEVLRWIRAQPVLDCVLVVVCSSSADARDVTETRRLRANAYLPKYPDAQKLAALLTVGDLKAMPAELSGYSGR